MIYGVKSREKLFFIVGFLQAFLSIAIFLNGVSGTQNISYWTAQADSNDILSEFTARLQMMDYLEKSGAGLQLKNILQKINIGGYSNFYSAFLKETDTAKRGESSSSTTRGNSLPDDLKSDSVMDFIQILSSNYSISKVCAGDAERLLRGIVDRKKWVIPFVDSTGKPGPSLTLLRLNFVGNYKQCRSAKSKDGESRAFRGNYCVIGARPKYQKSPNALTPAAQLGACIPDSCSAHDLNAIVNEVMNQLNLTSSLSPTQPDCRTDEREITTATIFAIIVLVVIGALMLLGTLYDIVWVQQIVQLQEKLGYASINQLSVDGYEKREEPSNSYNGEASEVTALRTKSVKELNQNVLAKILLAFSVYTNGKKVLNTNQPAGTLSAVHGIRFLSMSWVILGHVFLFISRYSDNTVEISRPWSKRWTIDAVVNAFPSVDTFFTMSGLLTSYLTITEMKKSSWKINWLLFYFHRFWRLTPPYMLSIVLFLGLQRFLGSGPLWQTVQPVDKAACEKNWWTNLLYINNFVKPKDMCFAQTWYLANDMQFFIISPLMLIPFYFHRLAGLATCSVFLLATWITSGVLSYRNQWPITTITLVPSPGAATWFSDFYIVPWCRLGPFVIGILAGFVLSLTNGGKNLTMKWWMVILGWLVATASGLAVVYGIYGDVNGEHMSSNGVAAFYNAVSRSVWGACVAWVIISCASGYGGPVNSLLSWSPFVFLGRLTYMSYLIHLNIIYIFYMNSDSLYHINDTNMVVEYLGVLVLVNMAAFVFMLGLESPMIGLEKTFIRKRGRD